MNEKTSKIIRIAIGKNFTTDWNVEGDKKALLLTRNTISTKLKLARPFVIEDGKDKLNEMLNACLTGVVDDENKVYFASSDFLPFDASISKENYNVLLRKKKDANEIDSLVIIDISNDVTLLRYMSEYEIMNSYHSGKTDTPSHGCFIKIPVDLEPETEICRLQTCEGKKFYQYIITVDDIKKFEINKPTSIASLKKIQSSMKKTKIPTGFKVTPRTFPTKFLISCTRDDEDETTALERIRKFVAEKYPETETEPFAIVLTNKEQSKEEILEDLKEIFTDPEYSNGIAIKALTTYEYRLDYSIIKALKLNYIFNLDTTGNLKTLKSN